MVLDERRSRPGIARTACAARRDRRHLDGRLRRAASLGSRPRNFCAVGGQSPALWLSAGETAPGAFDDAQDYARNDVFKLRPPHPLWIDLGASDPFHDAALAYARQGRRAARTSRRAGTTSPSGTPTCRSSYASSRVPAPEPFPKIELHVHLEGTVRPDTLRAIAKRNDYALPDDLESLYRFRDFAHFIEVWILTTNALRTDDDFRQIVVDYAAEAAAHGAVYLEGIFCPAERVRRGARADEMFGGVCDGAQEARELHGVEVRLTPDIPRGVHAEEARKTARYAAQVPRPRRRRRRARRAARRSSRRSRTRTRSRSRESLGLGSVPHAGEAAGAASVRGALEALGADRIRHGIRAVEDPGLVARARRPRHRARRLPALEPPHRRRRLARGAPAAAARRRRRPLLDLDRRPGDVRHRPHARLRGGRLARRLAARGVRGRRRRRALRRRDARAPAADRRAPSTWDR